MRLVRAQGNKPQPDSASKASLMDTESCHESSEKIASARARSRFELQQRIVIIPGGLFFFFYFLLRASAAES